MLNARTVEVEQYNAWRSMVLQTPGLLELWTAGLRGDELSEMDEERFMYLCSNYTWLGITSFERSLKLGRQETASQNVKLRGRMLRDNPGFKRWWGRNRDNIIGYGIEEYVIEVEAVAEQ